MNQLMLILFTGVIGATLAIAVLYAVVWKEYPHGALIRDFGRKFTKKRHLRSIYGVLAYYACGIVFAIPFHYFLPFLQFETILATMAFATLVGVIMGAGVAYLVADEAPKVPRTQVRKGYFLPISLSHWLAAIVFGLAQGALIGSYLHYGTRGAAIAAFLCLMVATGIFVFAD